MTCAVCARPVRLTSGDDRGRQVVCRTCFGKDVMITTASTERVPPGRTFYVGSLADDAAGPRYVVKCIGRRTTCTCPDYTHRAQVLGVVCKHGRLVRLLARAAHGIANVPRGVTVQFRIDDGFAAQAAGA